MIIITQSPAGHCTFIYISTYYTYLVTWMPPLHHQFSSFPSPPRETFVEIMMTWPLSMCTAPIDNLLLLYMPIYSQSQIPMSLLMQTPTGHSRLLVILFSRTVPYVALHWLINLRWHLTRALLVSQITRYLSLSGSAVSAALSVIRPKCITN